MEAQDTKKKHKGLWYDNTEAPLSKEEISHVHWEVQLRGFIKYYRKKRKLTMDDLAIKSGINKGSILNIEMGHNSPTFRTVAVIFQSLGVSMSDFSDFLRNKNLH